MKLNIFYVQNIKFGTFRLEKSNYINIKLTFMLVDQRKFCLSNTRNTYERKTTVMNASSLKIRSDMNEIALVYGELLLNISNLILKRFFNPLNTIRL